MTTIICMAFHTNGMQTVMGVVLLKLSAPCTPVLTDAEKNRYYISKLGNFKTKKKYLDISCI